MHLTDLWMVWCSVVQILAKECQTNVEFKTLFPIMKKHLSDGDDVPYFFRELMAMIKGTCRSFSRSEGDKTEIESQSGYCFLHSCKRICDYLLSANQGNYDES